MGTLGLALRRLGDPRQWTLPAEALALLEPLRPGPDLVAALTEVARAEALQGRNEAGDRATPSGRSTLAEELGLPAPPAPSASAAWPACDLGDRGGLDDYREAITLATEAGQGREVALLHNNLGCALWAFEGPVGVPGGPSRRGSPTRRPAGSPRCSTSLTASSLDVARRYRASTRRRSPSPPSSPPRLEASGDVFDLSAVRAVQARILTLRGQAAEVADMLDWLEATASETREPGRHRRAALARAAFAPRRRSAKTRPPRLLAEIEAIPGSRENQNYAAVAASDGAHRPRASTIPSSPSG